ncbi:hypothetical protein [Flavobacterium cerinum]|uniref:Uncharacterized protein n=1 Tax=Flavobacterium cerinum TaxID=2502784 RepID=A0A3S3QCP1_9FLAO|nr:hypothetical protein [Flavobacterium cerinum]RWW99696.1 hypothetical protein EPI11_12145 [Flavobacterium cerinum]
MAFLQLKKHFFYKGLLLLIANVCNVLFIYVNAEYICDRFNPYILFEYLMAGFSLNASLFSGFAADNAKRGSFLYVALLVALLFTFVGEGTFQIRFVWFLIQIVSIAVGVLLIGYKRFL